MALRLCWDVWDVWKMSRFLFLKYKPQTSQPSQMFLKRSEGLKNFQKRLVFYTSNMNLRRLKRLRYMCLRFIFSEMKNRDVFWNFEGPQTFLKTSEMIKTSEVHIFWNEKSRCFLNFLRALRCFWKRLRCLRRMRFIFEEKKNRDVFELFEGPHTFSAKPVP